MRILLMVPDHAKADPLWPALTEALESRAGAQVVMNYGEAYGGDPVDLVLPFDEMLTTWYAMRAQIPGRYRTIGCAFRFLDLYEFMRSFKTVQETGLSALFSNCKSFIAQFGQSCPSTFAFRPVVEVPKRSGVQHYAFVSVIDKVADQDFSFAEHVAWRYGNKFWIFALKGALGDFPGCLAKHVVPVTTAEPEWTWYQHGRAYIPTPRITDYRGGLIPIDYFKALRYNCLPILVKHPLTMELAAMVPGLELQESMKGLDAVMDRIADGAVLETPHCELPSVRAFAAQIVTAYKRLESAHVAG